MEDVTSDPHKPGGKPVVRYGWLSAALAGAMLAGAPVAEAGDNGWKRGRGHHHHHHHGPYYYKAPKAYYYAPPVVYGPPVVYAPPPPVYYAPPPAYYAPVQPGVSLGINVPLR